MAVRVYLDTTVFSAYWDERAPDRMAATVEFWARRQTLELSTSELTITEMSQTPDQTRREMLQKLLEGVTVHPLTEQMRDLAARYVAEGVFMPSMVNDALHVAAAVLTRQDALLSWNFRHLVNRRRRAQINQVNISLGLPSIEIVAPPEL
jgi:predicted nucleic acid-binding protein